MDRTLDSVGNGYRLNILGDLNRWIASRTRSGITGAFGVPRDIDNGGRVVGCYVDQLCVGNTYFKHTKLLKYTRVARGQDGEEIKNMIDLVLLKRDMLRYVQYMWAVKEIGRGTLGNYVIMCKVRFLGAWTKRRKVVVGARRIKSENLREHQYREGYVRSLEGKGVKWDGDNDVDHMWEHVKRAMVESAREVCGSVRVGDRTQRVCDGTMR